MTKRKARWLDCRRRHQDNKCHSVICHRPFLSFLKTTCSLSSDYKWTLINSWMNIDSHVRVSLSLSLDVIAKDENNFAPVRVTQFFFVAFGEMWACLRRHNARLDSKNRKLTTIGAKYQRRKNFTINWESLLSEKNKKAEREIPKIFFFFFSRNPMPAMLSKFCLMQSWFLVSIWNLSWRWLLFYRFF